jgi:hypothetical protein
MTDFADLDIWPRLADLRLSDGCEKRVEDEVKGEDENGNGVTLLGVIPSWPLPRRQLGDDDWAVRVENEGVAEEEGDGGRQSGRRLED